MTTNGLEVYCRDLVREMDLPTLYDLIGKCEIRTSITKVKGKVHNHFAKRWCTVHYLFNFSFLRVQIKAKFNYSTEILILGLLAVFSGVLQLCSVFVLFWCPVLPAWLLLCLLLFERFVVFYSWLAVFSWGLFLSGLLRLVGRFLPCSSLVV